MLVERSAAEPLEADGGTRSDQHRNPEGTEVMSMNGQSRYQEAATLQARWDHERAGKG